MLGEHDLKAPEVPAARQESIINVVLHPGHRCGKYVDDIALLELARPISWSESVKPACLPVATGKPGYSAFGGMEAVVAGWGWFGEDRSKYKRANVLQKVDVRVVENTVCTEWYASQGKSIRVATKQMCAGWEEGGRDSCWTGFTYNDTVTHHNRSRNPTVHIRTSGEHTSRHITIQPYLITMVAHRYLRRRLRFIPQADSGGPLMVGNRPADPLMVIGVVSTGIGCSRPRLPGIYTRVSDYVAWITQETQRSR
ncbi:plasminogen [Ooceraea biroi]|nr:plasminogen [Ooceraea biroi]